MVWSHSTRSAWIETTSVGLEYLVGERRTPHGVRGLKPFLLIHLPVSYGRTPHGVRGLKLIAPLPLHILEIIVALHTECVD